MRTVIFVGLLMIADAISCNPVWADEVNRFLVVILIAAIIMDLVEYVNGITRH